MKRWLPLAIILIAGIAAIIVAQRSHINTRPGPQAILYAAADAQHEITRVPARLDRLSDEDEIAIGDELAASYQTRWKPNAPEQKSFNEVQTYIQQVGARVAPHARRKLPYKFHYIPDPYFINAFALPGGHVFVGAGLLRLMQSEDALAAVLGHEIEHIDLRHCAERVQTERQLRHLGPIGDLIGLPVELFTAGYSKDQELEADRYGTALAVADHYSPAGILQLFKEFGRLEHEYGDTAANQPATPIDEATNISLQTLSGYFQSHPPAAQRSQQITTLIQSEHWPKPPLLPLLHREEFPAIRH
jgi:beta-barrel assembly-enhancing protease